MSSAVEYLTKDHRDCDELWATVESAADGDDLPATREAFAAFDRALRRHLDFEESVLFPALEEATGMRGGPTAVMRMEHDQMRRILATMASALEGGDASAVLDHGDTLLMLIQQHNSKEEHVLYPLSDARIGHLWPELRARF